MSNCDKFDFKSKQKMKKMIELSYKDGCEYFSIIKKDFTLGEITKGAEGECFPNELIESNKGNVIGMFHTRPFKKEIFNETLYVGTTNWVDLNFNLNGTGCEIWRIKK